MHPVTTWSTNIEQGTSEIAKIVASNAHPVKWEIRETAPNEETLFVGDTTLVTEIRERINAMSSMIELLSPGAQDNPDNPDRELRRLQQLIFGNLKCVTPPLEPFKE